MEIKFLLSICAIILSVSAANVPEIVDILELTGVEFDQLPIPEELAFELTEDEFEDYLDYWLYQRTLSDTKDQPIPKAGCAIPINTLSEPQPIYGNAGSLLMPSGNSGTIVLSGSQAVSVSCPGTNNGLLHSSTTQKPTEGTLICVNDQMVSSPGWLPGTAVFGQVLCNSHAGWTETKLSSGCSGGGSQIAVSLAVAGKQNTIFTSCFHESRADVLYVAYDQNPEHAISQPNVNRPSFSQGSLFPGLNVDNLYTQNSQKTAFDTILGSSMSTNYINATFFLARGHLAAKTDYIFSPDQRATFTFINVVPQWQPFNAGNWNTLEQTLRTRIGNAGYRTKVYTGSWGVLQLKNSAGAARDIYLSTANNKIPVPMWLFKVVHDPSTNRATAFLGLNNPHVTLAEAKALAFCTDVCNGNSAFSWLTWKPSDIGLGYSLCCDVNDFRKTVTTLPSFTSSGILS